MQNNLFCTTMCGIVAGLSSACLTGGAYVLANLIDRHGLKEINQEYIDDQIQILSLSIFTSLTIQYARNYIINKKPMEMEGKDYLTYPISGMLVNVACQAYKTPSLPLYYVIRKVIAIFSMEKVFGLPTTLSSALMDHRDMGKYLMDKFKRIFK